MKTLGDNYTLNVQAELPRKLNVDRFLNKNVNSESYFFYADSSSSFPDYSLFYPLDIHIKLADTSGIIYAATDSLSKMNAHVDTLKHQEKQPLFKLNMPAMIPSIHKPEVVCVET